MLLLKKLPLLLIIVIVGLTACNEGNTPLPRAYFRIDLPEKEHTTFDTIFPYSFTYPKYAQIIPDRRPSAEPYWADLFFPDFEAVVHLSYKKVQNPTDLNEYIEDGRGFVNRHIPKATGFSEKEYISEENRVYGILYEIKGKEAATPLQFYLTDSTDHFLRGSLYFNATPNNDSLAPVIDFIRDDIMLLIESLEWKN